MPSHARTFNALIIEDNPDDVEFLTSQLGRVTSGEIHVESCDLLGTGLLRLAQGGIDIVFLDLSLPDSNGIDTLIRTTKLLPAVPVIVLTGIDDDALSLRALKSGAQDYLVKGQLEPMSLGRSINYAIERQRSAVVESLFKAVVDSSNFAVIGKSLENTIISWNIGAETMYGYKAAEIIGKPNDILIPPDRPNDDLAIIEKIKRGEHVEEYQTKRRRKDGSYISVLLAVSPIKSSDGVITAVSVIARDITQQKLTEEALRESDERLKLSIRASRIGLWDWELNNDMVRWDAGMYKLFGVTEGQFLPSFEAFMGFVHADDRERVKQTVENVALTVGEFAFDFRALWTDGTICYMESKGEVFCDERGKPLRMSGACFDITDRKLAETALQAGENRLRLALVAAKMGVWDWDFSTGKVWRSLRHDEIFGYESMLPDWTYEMFLTHVVPADRAAVEEIIDHALDQAEYRLECRITRANDHAIRWISSHGEVHKDDDGNVVRILGTIADITDTKLKEQAAEDVQKRLNLALEAAAIGLWDFDLVKNSVWRSLRHDEIFGHKELLPEWNFEIFTTYVVPEDLASAKEAFQSGVEHGAFRMQCRIIRADDKAIRFISVRGKTFWNEQGTAIRMMGSVADITDIKEKQEQQRLLAVMQEREDFMGLLRTT